jgi:hypothetical protein
MRRGWRRDASVKESVSLSAHELQARIERQRDLAVESNLRDIGVRSKRMVRAHTTHEADCSSPARRFSSACCYLAIASLLVACGGYVATECATGPSPAVLAWDAVMDPKLNGYRVYYGTAPGTYLQSVDVVSTATTVTMMGLSSGTTYYFAVTAYDMSIPANESLFSNEICKRIS